MYLLRNFRRVRQAGVCPRSDSRDQSHQQYNARRDLDHVRRPLTEQSSVPSLSLTMNSFVIVMLAGAWLSISLAPETRDLNGKSRKLEELAKGKNNRKMLEREEREADGKRRH